MPTFRVFVYRASWPDDGGLRCPGARVPGEPYEPAPFRPGPKDRDDSLSPAKPWFSLTGCSREGSCRRSLTPWSLQAGNDRGARGSREWANKESKAVWTFGGALVLGSLGHRDLTSTT